MVELAWFVSRFGGWPLVWLWLYIPLVAVGVCWLGYQSSGGHRAVLFDLGRSHPGIDMNSEVGPHGIEKRSGFGRCSERCRCVAVLLSLEDTFYGRGPAIVMP